MTEQHKVTRVSPYGFQVDNKNAWMNWDKSYNDKPKLNVGSIIEYSTNDGGYVNSCKIVPKENQDEEVSDMVDNHQESIIAQSSYASASRALRLDVFSTDEVFEEGKKRLHALAEEINKKIPR